MWPILPYDIIAQIIDTVGEDKDTELLKELSLLSHSFHQICCTHLFATVELHDPHPKRRVAFTKNRRKESFVKLLTSRPDAVKYIRKLTYEVSYYYVGLRTATVKYGLRIGRYGCGCRTVEANKPTSTVRSWYGLSTVSSVYLRSFSAVYGSLA
jgi:hypothetical protein